MFVQIGGFYVKISLYNMLLGKYSLQKHPVMVGDGVDSV